MSIRPSDPILSPPSPLSPRSPTQPTIASLPLTGVVEQEVLQPMQDLQRQQSQPAAVPALSRDRASLSDDEDMIALVAETLKETSSATTGPAAVPRQVKVKLTFDEDPQFLDSLQELDELLFIIAAPQYESLTPANNRFQIEQTCLAAAKKLSSFIGLINCLFKSLIDASKSPDLGLWLERESQSHQYQNLRPFATSYFLTLHLEKAFFCLPHLNDKLIKEWRKNYHSCVLLLKQNGLDAYNETEFPFPEDAKPYLQQFQMAHEMMSKDPAGTAAQLMQLNKEFDADPEAVIRKFQEHDPAQAEILRAQMASLQASLPPHRSFFEKLDQQLKSHPQDKDVIEAWLRSEAAKPDYLSSFYFGKTLTARARQQSIPLNLLPPFFRECLDLFNSSCQKLVDLGLEHWTHEDPSPALIAQQQQEVMPYKAGLERKLEEMLSHFFRPLNDALKALPVDQTHAAHRQAIEKTLKSLDHKVYFPHACMVKGELVILEGVLDNVNEFRELYYFCCQRLVELDLDEYLHEKTPVETLQSAKPAAPKKALSNTERLTKELEFFRLMIKQDDKTVAQWVKDNSPAYDYPLLWGKKRVELKLLSRFKDVQENLRRDWRHCYDTCLDRASVDTKKIPEDASPELQAFLEGK